MSTKSIRAILILMLVTLSALFITQAYWFKRAFNIQKQQLDQKVNIALRHVADELLKINGDTTSIILPISQIASNEYYIPVRSNFKPSHLDSLLRYEFQTRNLPIEFDYLITKPFTNTVFVGNTISYLSIPSEVACLSREPSDQKKDFRIRINNKTGYLLNLMGIWMYSSLTLLLLLAVFTFIIISIIKGKKLELLKKDFVNNMTHELKTPISNISVASDAIRNPRIQMDENKLANYVNIIHQENKRLHHLVDRVLQISSIEKEQESFNFEEVDLHQVIKKVTSNFDPIIQQKDGSIQCSLQANQVKVNGDQVHLSNVFYNLIENAIKYSSDILEINIITTNSVNGVKVEISDKGIGISKENQDRIFDKFFRAETGDLHNTKGYGLGLSYVKLVIEKHFGSITFNSSKDWGTRFHIYIPFSG